MSDFAWKPFLRNHKAFSCLKEDQLGILLNAAQETRYEKGETIVQTGMIEDSVFVIGSGLTSVVLPGRANDGEPIAQLGEGEIFGEMALIERRPRSATVSAMEPTIVLKITGTAFSDVMRKNSEFEFKILFMLSQRLRHIIEHDLPLKLKELDNAIRDVKKDLDTELRIIDASIRATQALYDQTSKRADEIIHSSERSRTRTTFAIAVIGVVVTIAGFFGIDKAVTIHELAGQAESDFAKISTTADKIGDVKKEIDRLDYANVTYLDLASLIFLPAALEQYRHTKDAQDTLRFIFTSGKDELISKTFLRMTQAILTDNRLRKGYIKLLEKSIDNKFFVRDEDVFEAYYIMLCALIIEGKELEFELALEKFKASTTDYVGESVKTKLKNDLPPELFEIAIGDRFKKFGPDIVERQKDRIQSVWSLLP